MENKHDFMGTENITSLIIKFSFPAILGMFVNALYNVVDRIYIGRIKEIGHLAIAGLGIVFPLVIISFSFALLFGIGSSACISLNLGDKKVKKAEKYLGTAIFLGIVVSILITIFNYLFLDKLLYIIGASGYTFIYAKDYFSIINFGIFALIMFNILNAVIRADGNPKMAMFTVLSGAIVNIVLDPILIFYFHLGVKGAAIATIISQYISFVLALYYFVSKYSKLKILTKYIRFDYEKAKKIILLGSSAFAIQIGFSLVNSILNVVLKKYGGDISISAMTIVQSLMTFLLMPIFGINQGIQPILGYNYGARKYKRVASTLLQGILGATVICIIGFVLIRLYGSRMLLIFNKNRDLIKITTRALNIYTLMLPIIGFQIVSSIYFQAIGKPRLSLLISLSRQILVMIPSLFLLSRIFGLNGIWYATPTADLIATLITFVYIMKELKYLKMEEN
ncbi:MATE family efflux transporter [Caviibacter abscessus]|uniref:MATE family efflux transporter n=1 Tax=Caviibacter abscessus TaxID=1766719 RepID=UPI000832160D|nr:MATE family efflux transporter [Caviibacter abscessus]